MQSNIDMVKASQGEVLSSLDDYYKQLSELKAVGDLSGQAEVLSAIAGSYSDRFQWDEALSSYKESLALFEETGEVFNQPKSCSNTLWS